MSEIEIQTIPFLNLQSILTKPSKIPRFFFFVLCSTKKGGSFGGMFGMLKGLVGSKSLTFEDMEPVLDKMKDHLIGMVSVFTSSPLSFTRK